MIEGLKITENYITENQEVELLSKIKTSGLKLNRKERNSISRYGSKLPYNSRVKSSEVPKHFRLLCERLVMDGYHQEEPDSVTVNEYKGGQGISYHFDSETSGPVITVLSLLGDAVMGMKLDDKEITFNVPRRTLVSMSGEARDKWKHCIFPVKKDRLSIVFRKGTEK